MAHQKQQKIKTSSQDVARIADCLTPHLIPNRPFPVGGPLEPSLYLKRFPR